MSIPVAPPPPPPPNTKREASLPKTKRDGRGGKRSNPKRGCGIPKWQREYELAATLARRSKRIRRGEKY